VCLGLYAFHRVKFEIEGSDGKPAGHISLWDLHQYVYNNPKLKALVDSQKSIQEAGAQQQEEGSQLPGHMVPYVEAPGDPYGMALPQEVVKQLAWVSEWRQLTAACLHASPALQPDLAL
jgi:hypothetical protein